MSLVPNSGHADSAARERVDVVSPSGLADSAAIDGPTLTGPAANSTSTGELYDPVDAGVLVARGKLQSGNMPAVDKQALRADAPQRVRPADLCEYWNEFQSPVSDAGVRTDLGTSQGSVVPASDFSADMDQLEDAILRGKTWPITHPHHCYDPARGDSTSIRAPSRQELLFLSSRNQPRHAVLRRTTGGHRFAGAPYAGEPRHRADSILLPRRLLYLGERLHPLSLPRIIRDWADHHDCVALLHPPQSDMDEPMADIGSGFENTGLVIFWMLNWIGMLACGLAMEAMLTLFTVHLVRLFLIIWIISNVSVCIYPIPVSSTSSDMATRLTRDP
ncbi:DUF3533 domain-containing protein [Mycena venus]|uniref:DUF3533 domain-containing protein n=1 Tax=Mycena venus TaxID=2733690 RepID=A0A8H6Y0N1_9AGAR|nr:DUF3533 domain-containing protein [Mycena venus]